MGFTHHKAQGKDEPKHTEITRCRRGKFLCLLPKSGRDLLPTCVVHLLFSMGISMDMRCPLNTLEISWSAFYAVVSEGIVSSIE